MLFFYYSRSPRLRHCNLAGNLTQNYPYQRKYTHSSKQPDETHQKPTYIQYWKTTEWSCSRFICMGRMIAIQHEKFEAGPFPAQSVLLLLVSQEHVIRTRSLYHQATSIAPIHTSSRESRGKSGKHLHSVKIDTNGSNWEAKFDLHQQKFWLHQP